MFQNNFFSIEKFFLYRAWLSVSVSILRTNNAVIIIIHNKKHFTYSANYWSMSLSSIYKMFIRKITRILTTKFLFELKAYAGFRKYFCPKEHLLTIKVLIEKSYTIQNTINTLLADHLPWFPKGFWYLQPKCHVISSNRKQNWSPVYCANRAHLRKWPSICKITLKSREVSYRKKEPRKR